MHTVTVTCTYEGPNMANNLPACAVPDNPLETPIPRSSALRLVEMSYQENSVGCQCMGSALTSLSSRSSTSLTLTTAAIWIFSEVRRTMRLRDCVTRERVLSSQEERSSAFGRTKRFVTTEAWHSPPYTPLMQGTLPSCGRCRPTE